MTGQARAIGSTTAAGPGPAAATQGVFSEASLRDLLLPAIIILPAILIAVITVAVVIAITDAAADG
jgi:hypothetical protein